jgi:DNA-binding transcriptional ArsR family regulator
MSNQCKLTHLVNDNRLPRLRAVHRALADPLRIRLFELLAVRPQSAKELAGQVGMRPDRLYHHLAQLGEAKLIEISEYRPLPGGKVERVYAPAAAEPPGDDATPADLALLFNAALETTRADLNAAVLAREAGQDRRISLTRTGIRLNERHLAELNAAIGDLLQAAQDHPDGDGVWATVLWTVIDRQDRRPAPGGPPGTHDSPPAQEQAGK